MEIQMMMMRVRTSADEERGGREVRERREGRKGRETRVSGKWRRPRGIWGCKRKEHNSTRRVKGGRGGESKTIGVQKT
eukprot:767255-Hanusia_phi.AAC.1